MPTSAANPGLAVPPREPRSGLVHVIIDTPAADSYLMRLAHSLADTLVSPINDSFIDVDVFSRVHHDRSQRGQVAHYADLVLEARRKRKLVDQGRRGDQLELACVERSQHVGRGAA